ncbi:hypothetical protein SLEP1_g31785 [Rubroshorea leprosula]|uniref:S-adenosyl-L-methionine-dependent methyltransferase n=1 Tax=Rubroshorea leprosula TaxID=152421 RepID=A0AAV5K9S8_9ROSI|nr:hypothetical protein SLEP1_g31785 [Rubroshorea leprosula]
MLSLPFLSSVVSSSPFMCKGNGWSNRFFPIHESRTELRSPSSASVLGRRSFSRARKVKVGNLGSEAARSEGEEENFQVLTAIRSKYNDIVIVDSPKSRMLLLDSTHNVHSIVQKGDEKWTGSYWDEFASLPAIIPEGPIAIYGLGGGTAAYLMLDVWPSLQLEGWEIDGILIDKAREYLGLSELEKHTEAGGRLQVHIGDVFPAGQNPSEGYAGIVIDLFSDGEVLAELQEVATWLELKDRLMPKGRFMVNCGGISEASKTIDGNEIQNSTIRAMAAAFPGQLYWKVLGEREGQNYLALTGPFPDIDLWSAVLPEHLSKTVKQWRPYEPIP